MRQALLSLFSPSSLGRGAAALVVVGLLLPSAAGAHAASTLTWGGGGSGGNIGTANNWKSNQVPGRGDFLVCDGNLQTLPQLVLAVTAGSITFNSGAPAFTLGGSQTLTIAAAGVINNSITDQTINTPVKVGAA